MRIEIAWLLLAAAVIALAVLGGVLLRHRSDRGRLLGAAAAGAITAVIWFWWAHGILFRPDYTTTALGISISLNVAFGSAAIASMARRS